MAMQSTDAISDLRVINDMKYSIIIPKYDNSGRKIKTEKIAEKVKKMAKQFGGLLLYLPFSDVGKMKKVIWYAKRTQKYTQ